MIITPASKLLELTKHRPFPLADNNWLMYQQWKYTLFLHCPIRPKELKPLLPAQLKPDLNSGVAWISLVVFEVTNSRARLLPFIPALPTFNELNLRTYVQYNNIPGIYFLQIKASSEKAVLINRMMTKLRYRYGNITRTPAHHYFMSADKGSNMLDIDFLPGPFFTEVPSLDRWLTERYCCYQDDGEKLYRYDIHHTVWPLYQVQTNYHMLRYNFPEWQLTDQSVHLMHYSPLQTALIWPGKRLI